MVYSLTLKGSPDGLGERLSGLSWVTQASPKAHNGSTHWQVSVNDEAAAEANLLRYVLADPALTVTKFSRKKYELEEVFMAIEKGSNHDNH